MLHIVGVKENTNYIFNYIIGATKCCLKADSFSSAAAGHIGVQARQAR